jgi:hypothetical protein
MGLQNELAALYRRDLLRLGQQIGAFPAHESLWQTLPGIANSAGNLALHLEGNLREYIGRQLGMIPYERHRPAEFATSNLPGAELAIRLAQLADQIPAVIAILTQDQLEAIYPENVLGQPLTTQQFLIHLSCHLNYHLGQIDYLRRALTGQPALALAGL